MTLYDIDDNPKMSAGSDIDSHPEQQKENPKAHEESRPERYQQLLQQVPREFRASYFMAEGRLLRTNNLVIYSE